MGISCGLIGEDSLLIQCGNNLLSRHHHIEFIVSPIKIIQDWSRKNNIFCVSSIGELLAFNFKEIDYLFSIVNSFILPKDIIQMPKQGVINYHDSPLPKYAGLNATTWAILNNEKEHGVTWHSVNESIDAGDIIKQLLFPIYENDTAFTLNLRCYEHGIQSFDALLSDLEQEAAIFRKQDLQKRTYFGATYPLPNLGFIDWKNFSSEFVIRMSRALTLGHYNNNVGSLKIYIEGDYLVIPHVEKSPLEFEAYSPGTVLAIQDSAIYVSTIDGAIKMHRFMSKSGHNLALEDMIQQYNIKVGFQFDSIQDIELNGLKQAHGVALSSEKFWIDQLKDMTEHATFSSSQGMNKDKKFEMLESVVNLRFMPQDMDIKSKKNNLLAAILVYLYRLNNYEKTFIFIQHNDYAKLREQWGNFVSCFVPIATDWPSCTTLANTVDYVNKYLETVKRYDTYLTDISVRHPFLEKNTLEPGIVIDLTAEQSDISLPDNTVLYFRLDKETNELRVYHRLNLKQHSNMLKDVLLNLPSHLATILEQVINNKEASVSAFCFLTKAERNKLITDFGCGEVREIANHSITTLFENQVSLQPHRPAVLMGERLVSYHQLWQMSEKVTMAMRAKGIPSQSLIGIYFDRGIEMLAVILGILKAGCIYVPLDNKYPLLRIENIIDQASLSHIITTDGLLPKLTAHFSERPLLELHTVENFFSCQYILTTDQHETNSNIAEKLAYIMFTSGTTGVPKGVSITEKNIISYCRWFSETTNFNELSTIDFSSSIAFDLSVPCTLAPLLVGAQIAICADAEKANPERYLKHLKNNKVTHTELTPGYLEMLLNYPEVIKQLKDLKFLLLGADVVPTSDVKKWILLCPHTQIVNEYGPTETTVSATSYFVNNDTDMKQAAVPIGRPAFNTICYILDRFGNLCPTGIKGELYIEGAQVAKGYFGKPELTQEKFVNSSLGKGTMYKTGDLACWLPDGNLQFFGRNDHQVKIHGYRIELTEIEAMLIKIPTVQQAVVIVKQGHFKEKYLSAYLVSENKNLSLSEIKEFLSSRLSSYMIPKEFYTTDHIPLKDNEKIDFETLEKQACHPIIFEYLVEEELTIHEKANVKIWQNVFNNNAIGCQDDFFEIGGDSLLALQIVTELKKHYKIDIPLFYLFEYPTIARLSKKIEEHLESSSEIKTTKSKWIVQLSKELGNTPLFLVHPVGGSVFWYKKLAKYLEGKYTVYGIQDASIDGVEVRFDSLEAMATHYLKEIASIYNGTNYCLGGASFGATVAFEMAHQLINSNKRIDFLGIFDGWAEYPEELMKENTFNLLSKREKENPLDNHDSLIKLEEYRKKLLLNYKLSTLDVDITLYKATELWKPFDQIDDANNGWGSFNNGKITTYKVAGNHETMFFEPHVRELASQLLL